MRYLDLGTYIHIALVQRNYCERTVGIPIENVNSYIIPVQNVKLYFGAKKKTMHSNPVCNTFLITIINEFDY